VRYSGAAYDFADEGYPKAIADRWGNLPTSFRSGLDGALSFTSGGAQRLYLFKDDKYVRYTNGNYTQVDAGYPKDIDDGDNVEGAWFRGSDVHFPDDHSHQDRITIASIYVDTYLNQPRICLFYYRQGDPIQWKREYRVDSAGRYGWISSRRMDTV